ncbi:cytochrome P450 [Macrophomina phaseolina]|uniref:Cytochrome P450 n=1 Tax=Macrophomina phaseolina TaxID=35725 RepID=A0ABQ8G804_9PEZI|nr:cytochrome P450 [Macrophomina phaseolina]
MMKAGKNGELHLQLEKWARLYGEICRVRVGLITEFFINSDKAVKAIFDKSSACTSERPRWIIAKELFSNSWNVLLLNASDSRWKNQRRIMNTHMSSPQKADAGLPSLYRETLRFLYNASHDSDAGTDKQDVWPQLERYTYSAFAQQTFGLEIKHDTSPTIPYIKETGLAQIIATFPGSYIVDMFEVLDKLPSFMKVWERDARARFQRDMEWCRQQMKKVKKLVSNGKAPDALLPKALADEKLLGFPCEDEAAYMSMMLIIAAADTSQISTWSFLEAMLLYPDVQVKARQQIDEAVKDRLPVWEDLERLPYVRCLMKEVWRWRPPVALGHPHVTTRDLEYGGYRIPKGSRLHLNAWAIQHDPARHDDPHRFWPERYLNDTTTSLQSANLPDPTKRDHFAFGAGRRICPGLHVAERSLALAIMRILWACDIRPKPSAAGKRIDPADFRGAMPGNAGTGMPVALVVRAERRKAIEEAYARDVDERGEGFGTLDD